MNSIGNKIMLARKKLRYNQELLAEKLGITAATYSRYESGLIEIPRKRLESICNILQLNIAELLVESVLNETPVSYEPKNDPYQEIIRLQNELINCQRLLLNETKK